MSGKRKTGTALARVCEEDPTLSVDRNRETRELVLQGLGDVHIDVAIERRARGRRPERQFCPGCAWNAISTTMGGHPHPAAAMLVAQVSDPHVTVAGASPGAGVNSHARLASVLRCIAGLSPRPEAIVLSGDLVEAGSAAEYARLAALVAASPVPVHLMAGNHDDRDALARAFPDHAERFGAHGLHYVVAIGPLRLVMLQGATLTVVGGGWVSSWGWPPPGTSTRS